MRLCVRRIAYRPSPAPLKNGKCHIPLHRPALAKNCYCLIAGDAGGTVNKFAKQAALMAQRHPIALAKLALLRLSGQEN